MGLDVNTFMSSRPLPIKTQQWRHRTIKVQPSPVSKFSSFASHLWPMQSTRSSYDHYIAKLHRFCDILAVAIAPHHDELPSQSGVDPRYRRSLRPSDAEDTDANKQGKLVTHLHVHYCSRRPSAVCARRLVGNTLFALETSLDIATSGLSSRRSPVSTDANVGQDINALISDNERSIVTAKLKTYLLPPLGEVLSSEDERRCRVTGRLSFVTIQEMDLRERRMRSILDNSGFLLTDDPKTLGLTVHCLVRFKAGLKRALYITDRLADLETRPEVLHVQNKITRRLSSLQVGGDSVGSAVDENDLDKTEAFDEDVMLQHDAEVEAQHSAIMVHRNLQFEMIHELATLDIAWLLTLGEGATKGCTR